MGDLARKVRLSFPTRIVGRMIEKGELIISHNGQADDKDMVSAFLKKAEELGFTRTSAPGNIRQKL